MGHGLRLGLFGGVGCDSVGGIGTLNDLWEYNPNTAQWTWISGSDTFWAPGKVRTTNVPGGLAGTSSWTDLAANVDLIPATYSNRFSELALLTLNAGSHGTVVGRLFGAQVTATGSKASN